MKGACKGIALIALLLLGALGTVVADAEGPSATMNAWSPNLAAIPVGTPVIFHATGADASGVQGFEWDFNGDGEPDAQSAADSAGATKSSGSLQFKFDAPATMFPSVRAVNSEGFVSAWDTYDAAGVPVPLVIGNSAPPNVAMNQWRPYSAKGPDGTAGAKFTFSATASSAAGIAKIEWDFDGNGSVDATTQVAGSPASAFDVRIEHVYDSAGSWTPRVRAVDAAGLPSAWASYGSARLDIAKTRIEVTIKFAPAGAPASLPATYSFTATSTGTPARFEWDFEGDGRIDQTTTEATTRYSYTKYGQYLPSVTVVDATGSKTTAVPLASGQPAFVRLLPPVLTATMNRWSPYSPSGADGSAATQFTFSASAPGAQRFEWDFDGDGTVDATTPADASQVKTSYAYGRTGTFAPKVRAIDSFGQASAWASLAERLDVAGAATQDTYCDGRTIEQLIASGQYKVFDGRAGQKKALTGSAGKDLLIAGTAGSVIRALGGNDCIIGGQGNDVILAGAGDDQVFGNGGKDRIDGGIGTDSCIGAGAVNCERR
jgi:PKD repeat protein